MRGRVLTPFQWPALPLPVMLSRLVHTTGIAGAPIRMIRLAPLVGSFVLLSCGASPLTSGTGGTGSQPPVPPSVNACSPDLCVLNPAVTQATIHQTICVAGWTKTIRPPVSYTDALKRQQIAAERLTQPIYAYEEDHRMPLELGGSPRDPHNLSPEYPRSPNPKDRDESALREKVCSGEMSLDQARGVMASTWLAPWPGYKK